jgi:hypothetical protein
MTAIVMVLKEDDCRPRMRAAIGVSTPTEIMPVPTLLKKVAINFRCSFRDSLFTSRIS